MIRPLTLEELRVRTTQKEQWQALQNAGLVPRFQPDEHCSKKYKEACLDRAQEAMLRFPSFKKALIRELINVRRGNLADERHRARRWHANIKRRIAFHLARRMNPPRAEVVK